MPTIGSRGWPLSPAERNVALLLAQGKTNTEVAASLGVTTRTVENHRLRIFTKLGLRNAVEMVLWHYGIERGAPGLLDDPKPRREVEPPPRRP